MSDEFNELLIKSYNIFKGQNDSKILINAIKEFLALEGISLDEANIDE